MMFFVAMAQTETTKKIHGAVVDKNGNPLPGAVVSATEGAETTLVNADGTFELEIPVWLKSVSASYAGYNTKKLKPSFVSDMVFQLKKDNHRYGFLNALGGVALYNGEAAPSMGLMGGILGNVGFYAKIGFSINTLPSYIGSSGFEEYYFDADEYGFTSIVGITKRLYKNLYAYLGVGYARVLNDEYWVEYFEINEHRYYSYSKEYANNGMAFDSGLLCMIGRHFNVTVGYTHTTDFEGYWNCIPNVSLGYVF